MTRNLDLEHARQVAIKASKVAGDILRSRLGTDLNISSKGHADFVTEVDHECEEVLINELSKFDSSIFFMGEESTEFELVGNKVKIDVPSTCWIVDPLDGTSNYSHAFGAYGVSIGLRVDGEMQLGVINAPTLEQLVFATKGQGAWSESPNGTNEKRLSVADQGNHFNIFATSVPFRQPEYIGAHIELISKLFTCFEDMRRIGSASLELMWLANGTWAAFIERFLKPWDVAAGSIIVQEAGGIITDFSGDETSWLTNGEILATSSARVHEQIMTLIE